MADIKPPVNMLPPMMLPLSDAVVPVCVVALTLALVMLPPVMLPVADIKPPVNMLPPMMLPVALTVVEDDTSPTNGP